LAVVPVASSDVLALDSYCAGPGGSTSYEGIRVRQESAWKEISELKDDKEMRVWTVLDEFKKEWSTSSVRDNVEDGWLHTSLPAMVYQRSTRKYELEKGQRKP